MSSFPSEFTLEGINYTVWSHHSSDDETMSCPVATVYPYTYIQVWKLSNINAKVQLRERDQMWLRIFTGTYIRLCEDHFSFSPMYRESAFERRYWINLSFLNQTTEGTAGSIVVVCMQNALNDDGIFQLQCLLVRFKPFFVRNSSRFPLQIFTNFWGLDFIVSQNVLEKIHNFIQLHVS